jgi:hypothetical protein
MSERGDKDMVMCCIARLSWVYLYRCWESPASVMEVFIFNFLEKNRCFA